MKPKVKSKSKYNNGLPQFYSYKDKAISNNYSSKSEYFRLIKNFYFKYKKLLLSLCGIYIVYSWILNPLLFSSSKSRKVSSNNIWNSRKNQVKATFLESWNDYVSHGWGNDVYGPVSHKSKNIGQKPLGWIIVDSLDTLILMDCQDELEDAKSWVDTELNYDVEVEVNVFETTIRMLGGLLSAHYLSKEDDTTYLEKAVELGNKLINAFDTSTGIPVMELNLHTEKPGRMAFPALGASTAEIATLQLEFKYLSNLTGEAYFWDASEKVMQILDSNQFEDVGVYDKSLDGLAPIYVKQNTGKFNKNNIRLGSRGDSYYEYLLKQYLQTNEDIYLSMYQHAYDGIVKHLKAESYPSKYVYFGELPNGIGGELDPKMDHLVCFIGGLFALGATNGLTEKEAKDMPFWNTEREKQLKLAKDITNTCYHMYHDTPGTGLSPEIVVFNPKPVTDDEIPRTAAVSSNGDFYIKSNDKHNLQRPETVESLYVLYKITGDIKYREWGWEIFQNFVQHTKVTDNGEIRYTTLKDCTVDPSIKSDNMESFWLAETLKYLYLLFDDTTGTSFGTLKDGSKDKWDLRNIVFNTEAHPLPRFDKKNFGKIWTRGVSPLNNAEPKKVAVEDKKPVDKLKDIKQSTIDDTTIDTIDYSDDTISDDKMKYNVINDNIAVADNMKEKGEKPVAKQPIGKSLEEQVEEAINPSTKQDKFIEVDTEHENSKKVAEKMKASGEKPVAKQPVAKPLNQQAEDAVDDLIKADQQKGYDDDDASIEAEDDDAIKNSLLDSDLI